MGWQNQAGVPSRGGGRCASLGVLVAALGAVPLAPAMAHEVGATAAIRSSALGSAAGGGIDVVAERAYLRTGSNSGAEVSAPGLNERVVFHVDWRVDGSSPPLEVSFRALLDGDVFCFGVAQVAGGDSITTFCNAGWFATAGAHQLTWELDYTQAIGETNGSNNSASRAWGTGSQVNVDVRANRAYMRSGPGSGAEVDTPVPGQTVYFHLNWSETDLPTSVAVPLRATIDGEQVCAGAQAANGTTNAWCTVPWEATAGDHVLRWELDDPNFIAEVDEENNDIERSFFVGAVATPTPAHTSSPTVAVPSPTHGMTSTPAVETPTATRTRGVVVEESYFGRGDADCTFTKRAADVVATLRGLRGESLCGNDDCDRDGLLTVADAECAAGCLFGSCGVPPNAPRVTGIAADSAPDIVPGSVVTVRGDNLGGASSVKRAVVGGVEAEVVGFEEDELTIVVPFIEPGPTDLVIYDGEIASLPLSLTLLPPRAVGPPDTLDDLLALLDEVSERFAGLDLTRIYEEEEVPTVLEALADFRAEIAARPQADLSPDEIAALDFWADASGIPEQLRNLLAELDAFEDGQGSGAGAPTIVVSSWAGAVYRGLRWLGTSGGTAGIILRTPFGLLVAKGVVAGVVVVGAVKAGIEIGRPGAFNATFFDGDGVELVHGYAAAGGRVRIRMSTLFPTTIGIDMIFTTAFGQWRLESLSCGINCRDFFIPNAPGVCGVAFINLARGPILGNAAMTARVQPALIDAGPPFVDFEEPIEIFATGFLPCETEATFLGPLDAFTRMRISKLIDTVASDPTRLVTPAAIESDGQLRELPPGVHDVGLRVEGVDANETNAIRFRTRVQGVEITCDRTDLTLPSVPGPVTDCQTKPLPESVELFPVDTELNLQSSNTSVVGVPAHLDFADAPFNVTANGDIGSAMLTGEAFSSGVELGMGEVTLRVDDRSPPTMTLQDNIDPLKFSSCGSGVLTPGQPFRFQVQATDNHRMLRLRVRAPEESVVPADVDFLCAVEGTGPTNQCVREWSFSVRDEAPADTVELRVEATDLSGNRGEERCSYTVERVELMGFVFTLVDVHELTITSCNIPNGNVTVSEVHDRRGNVSEAGDPIGEIARDNLLRIANRKRESAGAGWIRADGRDCPVFTSVLSVSVTQVDRLSLAEAQERLRNAPKTETMPRNVQGCEIRNDCE